MNEPQKICLFQKFKSIKDMPFGKTIGYKTGCKLTATKSSYMEIFIFHLTNVKMMECEPEKCPFFNPDLITSEKEPEK